MDKEREAEITHCKQIIDGLLYDTRKASEIVRGIFVTDNGRYFETDVNIGFRNSFKNKEIDDYERVFYAIYSNIRPLTKEDAKVKIGLINADKYIEIFGEVEKA